MSPRRCWEALCLEPGLAVPVGILLFYLLLALSTLW